MQYLTFLTHVRFMIKYVYMKVNIYAKCIVKIICRRKNLSANNK